MTYDTQRPHAVTKPRDRMVSWARVDRDKRHAFAGQMFRRCASVQKVLSLATGHHKSWISRQVNGDPTGAVQRFYDLLKALTADPNADPSHLLVGGLVQISETLGDLPTEELFGRFGEALAEEARAQAAEDVASFEVLEVMARVQGAEAMPEDLVDLHEALLRHEEAMIAEMAISLTLVLLGNPISKPVFILLDDLLAAVR